MAEPYTDRYGYPLTSSEALRRVSHTKSRGYYRNGVWVRVNAKKSAEAMEMLKDKGQPK